MVTYKLSDEELQKLRQERGWAGVTKEEYLALKEQGKSDAEVRKALGIDYNKLYMLKKQWGLIGKFRGGKKVDVQPVEKENEHSNAGAIETNDTADEVIDPSHVEKAALDIATTTDQPDNPSLFRQIANEIADILERKNHDYGDSFGELYREFGDISSAIRLTDKLKRFRTLIDKERRVDDESIEDTLRDIAGYAILTLVEKRKMAMPMEVAT
ncbi:DUF1599 domain-containing protein [Caenibacillus caldisaponilyticus]|uniref:DUF1599 domain-containing protein n=1 Tax=Caenibacillus caldisaponilyticus TaxID=1674942 RepID=UPI0019310006|nr:DUF1599 domain-containing protein [Caenibacillus caldisaponilyticus]